MKSESDFDTICECEFPIGLDSAGHHIPFGVHIDEFDSSAEGLQKYGGAKGEGDALRLRRVLPVRISGIDTQVFFLFDRDDRLRQVNMTPASMDDCDALVEAVRAAHGEPDETRSEEIYEVAEWRDTARGYLVQLAHGQGGVTGCSVKYRKLA
jgi:hypothetical protein